MPAMEGILVDHLSALFAGSGRRCPVMFHSDHRRVRDPGSAWGIANDDDRADIVDGVFRQQGLADRVGHCCRLVVPPRCPDRLVRTPANARDRAGRLTLRRGLSLFNVTSVAVGMAFLYLPIAILVIYSFNASRLVAVWGGWSVRWYVALLDDHAMLDAAATSLGIASLSAIGATALGTLAALALSRLGRFR